MKIFTPAVLGFKPGVEVQLLDEAYNPHATVNLNDRLEAVWLADHEFAIHYVMLSSSGLALRVPDVGKVRAGQTLTAVVT